MAEPIMVEFTTKDGKSGHIVGTPGTNFGLRLEAIEVVRLTEEYDLDQLPFSVMAAGYGDDEDWSGLSQEDITDSATDTLDTRVKVAETIERWWGPFEVWTDSFSDRYFDAENRTAIDTLANFRVENDADPSNHEAEATSFWVIGPDKQKVTRVFSINAEARASADVLNMGRTLDEDQLPYTPDTALGAIQSRLEAFEARTHNDGMTPEMAEAIDTLHAFIQQVGESGAEDLEWGEPNDCSDRMSNDPEDNDGRHYGVPHCIWCLQAM